MGKTNKESPAALATGLGKEQAGVKRSEEEIPDSPGNGHHCVTDGLYYGPYRSRYQWESTYRVQYRADRFTKIVTRFFWTVGVRKETAVARPSGCWPHGEGT
jgi:hypothetical protein